MFRRLSSMFFRQEDNEDKEDPSKINQGNESDLDDSKGNGSIKKSSSSDDSNAMDHDSDNKSNLFNGKGEGNKNKRSFESNQGNDNSKKRQRDEDADDMNSNNDDGEVTEADRAHEVSRYKTDSSSVNYEIDGFAISKMNKSKIRECLQSFGGKPSITATEESLRKELIELADILYKKFGTSSSRISVEGRSNEYNAIASKRSKPSKVSVLDEFKEAINGKSVELSEEAYEKLSAQLKRRKLTNSKAAISSAAERDLSSTFLSYKSSARANRYSGFINDEDDVNTSSQTESIANVWPSSLKEKFLHSRSRSQRTVRSHPQQSSQKKQGSAFSEFAPSLIQIKYPDGRVLLQEEKASSKSNTQLVPMHPQSSNVKGNGTLSNTQTLSRMSIANRKSLASSQQQMSKSSAPDEIANRILKTLESISTPLDDARMRTSGSSSLALIAARRMIEEKDQEDKSKLVESRFLTTSHSAIQDITGIDNTIKAKAALEISAIKPVQLTMETSTIQTAPNLFSPSNTSSLFKPAEIQEKSQVSESKSASVFNLAKEQSAKAEGMEIVKPKTTDIAPIKNSSVSSNAVTIKKTVKQAFNFSDPSPLPKIASADLNTSIPTFNFGEKKDVFPAVKEKKQEQKKNELAEPSKTTQIVPTSSAPSTSAPQPARQGTSSLLSKFMLQPDEYKCPSCNVKNKKSVKICVSCETKNPYYEGGAEKEISTNKPAESTPASNFSFAKKDDSSDKPAEAPFAFAKKDDSTKTPFIGSSTGAPFPFAGQSSAAPTINLFGKPKDAEKTESSTTEAPKKDDKPSLFQFGSTGASSSLFPSTSTPSFFTQSNKGDDSSTKKSSESSTTAPALNIFGAAESSEESRSKRPFERSEPENEIEATKPKEASTSTSLFPQIPSASSSATLFANPVTSNTAKEPSSELPKTTTPTIFGSSNPPSSTAAPIFAFGASSNTPNTNAQDASKPIFPSTSSSSSSSVAGNDTKPATSIFPAATTSGSTNIFAFGGSSTATPETTAPKPAFGSSFSSTGNIFGASATSSTTSPLFSQSDSKTSSSNPLAPATTTSSNTFLAPQPTTSSSNNSSLFMFGGAPSTSTPTPAIAPAATTSTSSTNASKDNLFAFGASTSTNPPASATPPFTGFGTTPTPAQPSSSTGSSSNLFAFGGSSLTPAPTTSNTTTAPLFGSAIGGSNSQPSTTPAFSGFGNTSSSGGLPLISTSSNNAPFGGNASTTTTPFGGPSLPLGSSTSNNLGFGATSSAPSSNIPRTDSPPFGGIGQTTAPFSSSAPFGGFGATGTGNTPFGGSLPLAPANSLTASSSAGTFGGFGNNNNNAFGATSSSSTGFGATNSTPFGTASNSTPFGGGIGGAAGSSGFNPGGGGGFSAGTQGRVIHKAKRPTKKQ